MYGPKWQEGNMIKSQAFLKRKDDTVTFDCVEEPSVLKQHGLIEKKKTGGLTP
jgi:hypothetical protein